MIAELDKEHLSADELVDFAFIQFVCGAPRVFSPHVGLVLDVTRNLDVCGIGCGQDMLESHRKAITSEGAVMLCHADQIDAPAALCVLVLDRRIKACQ